VIRESAAESEHEEHARKLIGRVIGGRWTLTRLVGTGGMASVFEAKHRNGRRAALKILHPAVAAQRTARLRFLSEGYAANKVEHPGAVLVLDDGEDGGLVFLVMELLRGRSLADRLAEEGPLAPAEVNRVASAVLDVLAQAHDRGVVHRDIKPSNVFEVEGGAIKVLDFGVAQVREPGALALTESGVAVGTPAFMAPEQAGGTDEVSAATDIWAVGATMFRLLTGHYVHDARTRNAALVAAATTPARPIGSLRPDVPKPLQAIVDRALALRPDDRFPNARAMKRALERAAGVQVPATPEDQTATAQEAPLRSQLERPPLPRRSGAWVLFLVLIAGAIVVVLARTPSPVVTPVPAISAAVSPPPAAPSLPRAALTSVPGVTGSPGDPAPSASVFAPSLPTPPPRRTPILRPKPRRPSSTDDSLIDTRQ
jgi:serine/threonine-protein kinase